MQQDGNDHVGWVVQGASAKPASAGIPRICPRLIGASINLRFANSQGLNRAPARSVATLCAGTGLLLALLLPSSTQAQTIPSPFEYLERGQEVGVFGTWMDTGTGRFGYGPGGGYGGGIRYAIELTGPLSFEGVWGLIDGERDVVDPGRVEGDRIIGVADSRITTIDARLRFSAPGRRMWNRLSPFIFFGGGIAIDASPSSDLDDILLPEDRFDFGTSFYGTLGLGTRWFVTDRIALRADGTFSLWKIETPPGFADPDRAFENVDDGEWLWGNALTVTLLWRW